MTDIVELAPLDEAIAVETLTEEEKYLVAILQDQSGLDLAEFCWTDPTRPDGCYRAYPYQWPWWRCRDTQQVDQCVAVGQPVLTQRGRVPIEMVQVGDMVFTHRQRWRRVNDVIPQGFHPVMTVVAGDHTVTATNDHRFWVCDPAGEPRWEKLADVAGLDGLEMFIPTVTGGGRWVEVELIADAGEEADCWDLNVEEDHSFTVSGIAVRNCSRSVGKSERVMARSCVFPFIFPRQEQAIVAPESIHVDALADRIEARILATRLLREMVIGGRTGINHRPFKCVAGGQLVLTARGHVPIEQVRVGDRVLTHRNRWREVLDVMDRGVKDVVAIKGMGHPGLVVTPDHKLWARRIKQVTRPTPPRAMQRVMRDPEWIAVEDWKTRDPATRWASPAEMETIAELPSPFQLNNRGFGVGRGAVIEVDTPEFMWFVGHYLAEGCLYNRKSTPAGVSLAVHELEVDEVGNRLEKAGFKWSLEPARQGDRGRDIRIHSAVLGQWVKDHLPGDARTKDIPVWAYSMSRHLRVALLEGYMYGDGHLTPDGWQRPSSASRALAVGVRLLALSLGWGAGIYDVPPHVSARPVHGRHIHAGPQSALHINMRDPETLGHVHTRTEDGMAWTAATRIASVGQRQVYDLTVAEDHSFVVEGIVVANCHWANGARLITRLPQRSGIGVKGIHPIQLDVDEGQDISERTWKELPEVVRWEVPGASWHVHGVSKGIQDTFYDITQEDSDFTVHRITAMHRPDWSPEEKSKRVKLYGSEESEDYRRNVWGEHGNAMNRIFVLSRLMANVDHHVESHYNDEEYFKIELRPADIVHRAKTQPGGGGVDDLEESTDLHIRAMLEMLEFPLIHKERYKTFWSGMDVGLVGDPSELLVFAEYQPNAKELAQNKRDEIATPLDGKSRLKLIARINMVQIPGPMQEALIMHVINHYGPRAFAMDKMQPVTEPVLTPSGWVPIGSLRVGDEVIGAQGHPTPVTGVYPQADRRVMKVTFNDGSWTRCGPEHLWRVKSIHREEWETLRTDELAAAGLRNRHGQRTWEIPVVDGPVVFAPQETLPIDPYLLGCLLGDGQLREHGTKISNVDPEILLEVERRLPDRHVLKHDIGCDYRIVDLDYESRDEKGRFARSNRLLDRLRALGLAGHRSHEKFIPETYLHGSVADRLALLHGLMDTDGFVNLAGNAKTSCSVSIRLSSEHLIRQIIELVESLGGSARYRTHATSCGGIPGRQAHVATLALPAGMTPFLASAKRGSWVPRVRRVSRFIASIEPEEDEESVCIRVAAADHLYVTRGCVVTHNTGLGLPIFQGLQRMAGKSRLKVLDFEDDKAAAAAFAQQAEGKAEKSKKDAARALTVIKGYNFSGKVVVEFDEDEVDRLGPGATIEELIDKAGVKRNVKDQATDELRALNDSYRWLLPYDRDLINSLNGQTWATSQEPVDAYGRPRRVYSVGKFHILDGARMAMLGRALQPIEDFLRKPPDVAAPVIDRFVPA